MGAQAGIKAGGARVWGRGVFAKELKRRRSNDLTTCCSHKALFFCAGPPPWTVSPGQARAPHWAPPHTAVAVVSRWGRSADGGALRPIQTKGCTMQFTGIVGG